MPRIPEKTLKIDNPTVAWKELLEKLSEGDDFPYYGIKPRKKEKYFYARTEREYIVIKPSQNQILPSGDISTTRTVDFKQFKCVFNNYNDYILQKKGIRPKIRDSCGKNSSYIISLIGGQLV
jgi:hypothetical protein